MSNIALNVKAMMSTELAELAGKKHFHVMRDIEVIIEQLTHSQNLDYSFKSTTYTAANDQAYKCYELDYEATMIVITGYNVVARAKVIRRWLELEQIVVVKESPTLKLEMDLVFAKAMSETLRLPESGKLLMFGKIERAHGLTPMLPVYAVDAPNGVTTGSSEPTKSATALLREHGNPMTAFLFNRLAEKEGLLTVLTRESKSQGLKDFKSVTTAGLAYGKNLSSPANPRETTPHWYISSFGSLLQKIK